MSKVDLSFYEQTITPNRYSKPCNFFDLDMTFSWIVKWFNIYLPGKSPEYHQEVRDEAYQLLQKTKEEFEDTAAKEYERVFKQPAYFPNHRITGSIRDEYSEKAKNKLRELKDRYWKYYHLVYAHNLILPKWMQKKLL